MDVDSAGAVHGFGAATRSSIAFETQLYRSAAAFRTVGRGFLIAGGLLATGLGYAIKQAANFEKELSFFKAVSAATEGQMEKVRQKAMQLGRDTKFSAGEVAQAFVELGKAGIRVEEIMGGVADATVSLAAAADIDLAKAATAAVNIMKTFELQAKDVTGVVDILAGAANASTIDIDDLATSMKYAGSPAHALGITVGDLAAALAILGNAGIRGSTGGTSMRRILLNLVPVSEKAATVMKELGIVTADGGNKFFDATGKAKSLAEIAQVLQDATLGLSDAQKVQALNTIFGNRAVASALILARGGAKAFNEMKTEIGKVTAEEVARERLNNLAGSLEILKDSINTAFIAAGSPLQKVLKGWVDRLTELVNAFAALPPSTQQTIVQIVAITSALLLLFGAISTVIGWILRWILIWRQLGRGLTLIAPKLKFLMGPFRLLGRLLLFMVKPTGLLSRALWLLRGAMAAVGAILGTTVGLVAAIVLAVAALAAGIYILYKRNEAFHRGVDIVWQSLQRLWDTILDGVGGAIGALVRALGTVVRFFTSLPGKIVRGLATAATAIATFFTSLPGRIATALAAVIAAVVDFAQKLPYYIGYAIGFVIGLWINLWARLIASTVQGGIDIVSAVIGFMTRLPGIVIGFLNLVWDGFYAFMVKMVAGAIQLGSDVVGAIVNFFQLLPGRVLGFLNAAWDAFWGWGFKMKDGAMRIGTGILAGIVDFVSQIPGKIAEFFGGIAAWIAEQVPKAVKAARDFGFDVFNGLMKWIERLPGEVIKIIGKIIQAFKDMAGKAASQVLKFGEGLVSGFLKGIGVGSPSMFERTMWQVVKNVNKSVHDLDNALGNARALMPSMPGIDGSLAMASSAGVGTRSSVAAATATETVTALVGAPVEVPVTVKLNEKTLVTATARGFVNHKRSRS